MPFLFFLIYFQKTKIFFRNRYAGTDMYKMAWIGCRHSGQIRFNASKLAQPWQNCRCRQGHNMACFCELVSSKQTQQQYSLFFRARISSIFLVLAWTEVCILCTSFTLNPPIATVVSAMDWLEQNLNRTCRRKWKVRRRMPSPSSWRTRWRKSTTQSSPKNIRSIFNSPKKFYTDLSTASFPWVESNWCTSRNTSSTTSSRVSWASGVIESVHWTTDTYEASIVTSIRTCGLISERSQF